MLEDKVVVCAGKSFAGKLVTEQDLIKFIETTMAEVQWVGHNMACHIARNLLDCNWVRTTMVFDVD